MNFVIRDRWIIFCVCEFDLCWRMEFHQKKVPNTTLKKHLKMMKSFWFFFMDCFERPETELILGEKTQDGTSLLFAQNVRELLWILFCFVFFQERIIQLLVDFHTH